MSSIPPVVELSPASVEAIARRVVELMRPNLQPQKQTLDTKGAMARMGYKSGKRFWEAVRRLGVPYERINSRHFVFHLSDIEAVLNCRRVGRLRVKT